QPASHAQVPRRSAEKCRGDLPQTAAELHPAEGGKRDAKERWRMRDDPRTRHFLCRRGGGFVSDRRNEKEAISRAFAKALDRTRGFGGGGGAGRLRGGLRSQEPGRLGPGGDGEVGGRQPARPALGPGDLP